MAKGGNIDLGQLLPDLGLKSFTLLMLIIGFMIFVIKFGGAVANRLLSISRRASDDQSIITLSLIILFAVAAFSDWLGLTPVIGAFLAGAILAGLAVQRDRDRPEDQSRRLRPVRAHLLRLHRAEDGLLAPC